MPANKNALIRYKTIDNCLRNRYRRWTIEDLVEACCEALYDMEGIRKGVSLRTVQGDLQMMRSDKLGYNAPIVVYNNKYYKYSDPNYSITEMPMSQNDYEVMQEAINMLRQLQDFDQFTEMADVVSRLQDKLAITEKKRNPIINFDNVPDLKGLRLLNPLYNIIAHEQVIRVKYRSFRSKTDQEYILCPHLLKEFRNRWFLFGSHHEDLKLYNLALDRIISYEVVDGIPYRNNPDFDSIHFFDDVIGVTKNIGDRPVPVTFWASPTQSRYIATKPIHPSQHLVSENEDGSCVFQIEVIVNHEMYSVFMSYGEGVTILSPTECAEHICEQLQTALGRYRRANFHFSGAEIG